MAAKPHHPQYHKGQDESTKKSLHSKERQAITWLEEQVFERKREKYPSMPSHALIRDKFKDNTPQALRRCVETCLSLGGWQVTKPTSSSKEASLNAIIAGRSAKIEIRAGRDGQSRDRQHVETSGGVYLFISSFQEFYDWYQDFLEEASMGPKTSLPKPFKTSNAQFDIVYQEFLRLPQTMKQVSVITGIDRANICWYCRELRKSERIMAIKKSKCPITRHEANFWTTDPARFPKDPQLSLFVSH